MEIKIGIVQSPRELTIQSDQDPELVAALITSALESDKPDTLELTDEKGRRYLVASARIAYVEIGPSDERRVGFIKH